MANRALNGVFAHIRKLASVQTARACGDGALIERFVDERDEAAFTVLVERHGPVVLGLCRRVLRHAQDADDACQAVFLVLARKAASLRKRGSLASWLHGVAFRICNNLKRRQARQRRRELRAEPARNHHAHGHQTDGDVSWRELHAILDEELERLPERYRAPLILCYLDGKTRDEAARALGATPGVLHGLLERGRSLLRQRLTQRGVTLSAALLVTAIPASAAKAALAPPLVIASTKAALALAGGPPLAQGLVAPHVLSLAQEVMKVMLFTKVKIGTAVLVCAGLLTLLAGGALSSVSLAQESAGPRPTAAGAAGKAESDEDFLRRVSKDLRGIDPSPAELHFFLANKVANKRQKAIDLFIQERQAKQTAQARLEGRDATLRLWVADSGKAARVDWYHVQARRFNSMQEDFYKQVLAAAKERKDVATITQNYLDRLMEYVKSHPKAEDAADAMLHIALLYRSQGKSVEADAWREKLRKEHPKSPAARTADAASGDSYWSVVPAVIEGTGDVPLSIWTEIYRAPEQKK